MSTGQSKHLQCVSATLDALLLLPFYYYYLLLLYYCCYCHSYYHYYHHYHYYYYCLRIRIISKSNQTKKCVFVVAHAK